MKKIYSKIKPQLLHIINKKEDITEKRIDLSPESEFLQVATLKLPKGQTFRPHKHKWKIGPKEIIAQEMWIVLTGRVKVILYDFDDSVLVEEILNPGDCSITFHCGHTYEILKKRTKVIEVKIGPYQGQKLDKTFIG